MCDRVLYMVIVTHHPKDFEEEYPRLLMYKLEEAAWVSNYAFNKHISAEYH